MSLDPTEFAACQPTPENQPDAGIDLASEQVRDTRVSALTDLGRKIFELDNLCLAVAYQLTKEDKIPFAWGFSPYDLHLAAISAYSDGNYTVPSAPREQLSEDQWRVTRVADPILFAHLVTFMQRADGTGGEMLDQAMAQGELRINWRTYEQYVDTYQQIVRAFQEDPSRYEERMGQIVGGITALCFEEDQPIIGLVPSDLMLVRDATLKLALKAETNGPYKPLPFSLPEGSLVFLPWRGIAAMNDFHLMAAHQNHKFIFQAESKFVAAAVDRASAELGVSNVAVLSGAIDTLRPRAHSVSLIFLSHQENRSPKEFHAIARLALKALSSEGAIFIYNHDKNPIETDKRTVQEIRSIFSEYGFRVAVESKGRSDRPLFTVNNDRRTFSSLQAAELLDTIGTGEERFVLPCTLLKITKPRQHS